MSIANKLKNIAENMQKVYESGASTGTGGDYDSGFAEGKAEGIEEGVASEKGEFWYRYTQEGNRTNWNNAFFGYGWNDYTYNPQTSFDNVVYCNNMFSQCNITDIIVPVNLTKSSTANGMFLSSTRLETIPSLTVHSGLTFSNTFKGCTNLKNLTIEGAIGKNGFDVQDSKNLTNESLLSILNSLEDKTSDTSGTDWVVTIGDVNKAKLTADALAIAQNKGWTVN